MKVYGGVMATLYVEPHHIIPGQGCRERERERAGCCDPWRPGPGPVTGSCRCLAPEAPKY